MTMSESDDRPEQERLWEASDRTRVFISYSRRDKEFVEILARELRQREFAVFVDVDDILPAEDWRKRLEALINQADAIVYVVSPDSVGSEICRWEIEIVERENKRLAPVVYRDVDEPAVPEGISRLNYVFARDGDDKARAYDDLAQGLSTDIDWVREHTRLGDLARRWDAHRKARHEILRGHALQEAEQWLIRRPNTAPTPTALQHRFIAESRRLAIRRQRAWTAGTAVVLVVVSGLGMWAEINRQRATAERDRALVTDSRRLAELARQKTADGDAETAALLALEALPGEAGGGDRPYIRVAHEALNEALVRHRQSAVLRHEGEVRDVTFSPDGRHVLTAAMDGKAKLWNRAGDLVEVLEWDDSGLNTTDFSPDGAHVAVGSNDGAVIVLDVETWDGHIFDYQETVTGILFDETTTDSPILYSWGLRSEPAIWAPDLGEGLFLEGHEAAPHPLFGHWSAVNDFARSPTEGFGVSVGADGKLILWELATARHMILDEGAASMEEVDFSTDGRMVFVGHGDGTVRALDLMTGSISFQSDPMLGRVTALDVGVDGDSVFFGTSEGDAALISAANGSVTSLLEGHAAAITDAAFAPNGEHIATSSNDGTARLWDTSTGRQLWKISGHHAADPPYADDPDAAVSLTALAFDPNGELLATAGADNTARLWRLSDLAQQTFSGDGHVGPIFLTGDGAGVIAQSGDALLRWNMTGTLLNRTDDTDGRLVAVDKNGTTSLFMNDTGSRAWLMLEDSADPVVLSDLEGEAVADFQDGLFVGAISPDGGLVAIGSSDGTIRIWDRSGKLSTELVGHVPGAYEGLPYGVKEVTFSPDGTMLLSRSFDFTARLWSVDGSQRLEIRMDEIYPAIWSMAMSPDGRTIAAAGGE